MQQPMPNPKDIIDSTTAMNMALTLMAKAFKLNYSTPTKNNQRISSNPRNMQIAQPGMNMGQDRQMQMVGGNGGNQFRQYARQNAGNPAGYNDVIGNQVIQNAIQNPRVQNVGNGNQNQIGNGNLMAVRAEGNAAGHNGNQIRCYNCRGVGHFAKHCTVRPRRRDAAYHQTQLLIAQKEEAGIQLQAEEYDLMVAAADIEEVNANCILMANLQQASSSCTQTDSTPVYDTDGSAENAGNPAGYNDVIGNQVIPNAAQNLRVQNVGNQKGLIGVQGNGIQNQIRNGNLVAVRAEGNAAGQNGNQIRCYNCRRIGHYARNCTAMPRRRDAANLQTQLLIA
nr:hypothetical protein [Tanacetum cinerariifolium]